MAGSCFRPCTKQSICRTARLNDLHVFSPYYHHHLFF
nr:MAG TPA: Transcriptional regulator binding protein, Winged Helix [Caudoviricetes sp.]